MLCTTPFMKCSAGMQRTFSRVPFFFKYVIPYGVEKVGFSKTHAAMYEQGIVCLAGILRDRVSRRVGELVTFSHREILKRVGRI